MYLAEPAPLGSTNETLAIIVIIIQSSGWHSEKLFTK